METIRDGIDTALAAITLTLDDVDIPIRPVQEIDQAPAVTGTAIAAMVAFGGANYMAVQDGQSHDVTFTITFLAGRVSERSARRRLDLLVDPSPGTTVLQNALDGRLGGAVMSCVVVSAGEYRNYTIGEADYLGCPVTVGIFT